MRVSDFWGLLGAFATIAMTTVIVSRPESSKIIKAGGESLQGVFRAVMGN